MFLTGSLQLFGRENVSVHEFGNPGGRHFRSFNVASGECGVSGHDDTWHGGDDTWYSRAKTRAEWRTCHCPVCDQALGWQWRRSCDLSGPITGQHSGHVISKSDYQSYDWLGLRLGSVSDWSDFLMGPLADLPYLMRTFGK